MPNPNENMGGATQNPNNLGGIQQALLAALAGGTGFLQSGPQQTNGTTTQSGTSSQSGSSTNNSRSSFLPLFTREATDLLTAITGQYLGNLGGPDMGGYRQQGIDQINNASNIQDTATQNALAARGLTYSPVNGILAGQGQANRLNQVNDFTAKIPLIADQLRNQNLGAAANFFRSIPTGQLSESDAFQQFGSEAENNSTSTTQNQQSGNRWGGLLGGLGAMAANLLIPGSGSLFGGGGKK